MGALYAAHWCESSMEIKIIYAKALTCRVLQANRDQKPSLEVIRRVPQRRLLIRFHVQRFLGNHQDDHHRSHPDDLHLHSNDCGPGIRGSCLDAL